jgi:hypothetical protein
MDMDFAWTWTRKRTRFFVSVRTETNETQSVSVFFAELKNIIGFFSKRTETKNGVSKHTETPKQAVSTLKRNNRNKRLVSDSAETSLGFTLTERKHVLFTEIHQMSIIIKNTLDGRGQTIIVSGHWSGSPRSLFFKHSPKTIFRLFSK